ncbi:MAG: iron-containing alcohol dehydrogenase, partial [Pseudomonas fluorescens]
KQIALSTTLSGSEFSHYFGVTGTDNSGATFKQSHVEAHATPAVVILDPELTLATPPRLWASSGIKAIDHAIEGLLCPGFRPTTDAVALTGIRAMAAALPSANVREALHERLMCQVAAWQCYFAPATIRFGLSHRIGHVLGGTYGVPHSVTSCITLAPVMRAFAELESSKLTVIAAALSPGQHLAVNPTTAADRLHDLVVQLDLPVRLRDVGIDRKDLSAIASLVARHYPGEVERLYPDARTGLGGLLEKMF